MASGDLVYFVIPVGDTGRARTFYGELLGWEFEPGNVPDGYQISNVEPPGGLHGGAEPSSPEVYFRVEDIHAAVAHVRALGGDTGDPQGSPSGAYARSRDDQGTLFGLWSPSGG